MMWVFTVLADHQTDTLFVDQPNLQLALNELSGEMGVSVDQVIAAICNIQRDTY